MASFRTACTWIGVAAGLTTLAVLAADCWHSYRLTTAVRRAGTPAQVAAAVAGENLKDLPDAARDRVLHALRQLAGKDDYWQRYGDGSPHRLFRWEGDAAHWVLVVTHEGMQVPGYSWMAVHQFDRNWQQTAVINFPTGYRIALFDVWKQDVAALAGPAIVVRLGSIGSFGDFGYRQRQYYAIRKGRVILARIEEEGGGVERGVFNSHHPWTGPAPPRRSVDDWVRSLQDDDPVVVLETLTWLGGHHMPANEPREEGVNQESVADARLFEQVRDDPRTATRLSELARSAKPW